jgi:choline dehydrogenase-like flavoprotein
MAAGAIHSPQILMLSGIGPKRHLSEHGIKCVADNSHVGSNLQDHPAVLTAHRLKESAGRICISDEIYDDSANVKLLPLLNWALFGKGALTSTACDRGAFIKSSSKLKQPDLQLRYVAGFALNPNGIGSYVDFGKLKVCSITASLTVITTCAMYMFISDTDLDAYIRARQKSLYTAVALRCMKCGIGHV